MTTIEEPNTRRLRVAIIDDYPMWRAALAKIVSAEEDFEVVATGKDGLEALGIIEQYAPDVLLLDLKMSGLDGLSTLRHLHSLSNCPTTVIVQTASDDLGELSETLALGARGILSCTHARCICSAIRTVRSGQIWLDPHGGLPIQPHTGPDSSPISTYGVPPRRPEAEGPLPSEAPLLAPERLPPREPSQPSLRDSHLDEPPYPPPMKVGYHYWNVEHKPVSVRLALSVIESLNHLAAETFHSVTSPGTEVGGLLLGTSVTGDPPVVSIEAYQAISCEYSRGPLYRLSAADLILFQRAIAERVDRTGLGVVGYFRSHTRKGLSLDPEDTALFKECFADPLKVLLLVRPFATKTSTAAMFIWERGTITEQSSQEFTLDSHLLPAPARLSSDDWSAADPDTYRNERRSRLRFRLMRDGRCRVVQPIENSFLVTVKDISSCGVWLTPKPRRVLPLGVVVEVEIDWPLRVSATYALRLLIFGRVVRSAEDGVAVAIERYEFRTASGQPPGEFRSGPEVRSENVTQLDGHNEEPDSSVKPTIQPCQWATLDHDTANDLAGSEKQLVDCGGVVMHPLTIGLAIEDSGLLSSVQRCLSGSDFRVVIDHRDARDAGAFFETARNLRPDVILVDISSGKVELKSFVASIREATANAMVIALNTKADAEPILAALRAGVDEYLYPPLHESLKETLLGRATYCRRRQGRGRVIAFVSAKGGCGATTLISHVAADLGRRNRKVLLTDLDFDAGMIGFITKTKSVYSVLDIVKNLHRLDIHVWRAFVSQFETDVHIIASPVELASQPRPTKDEVRRILAFARPLYDWIMLDLGHGLSEIAVAALNEIDEVYLVTTLDVPAMHQSKEIIQNLQGRGYTLDRLRLILNRSPRRLDMTPVEIERMLGVPVFCLIPNDYPELYETYAEGRMLDGRSRLGREISRLSIKLAGLESERPEPKKRFRLFW